MNRIKRTIEICLAMLLMLAPLLGASLASALPAAAQNDTDRSAFNQDLTIDKGDTVKGDVSVTNGNLTIYGTVDGKVSVVNGKADIYGKVLGAVAVLTGGGVTLHGGSSVGGDVLASEDIDLQDSSVVEGSVTSLGGHVTRSDASTVRGSVNEMTNPAQALQDLVQPAQAVPGNTDGSFNDSPLSRIAGLFSIGIVSVLILLLSVGMTAVIPSRVRTASATLQAEPGPSIVVGTVTAFLIFPAAGLVAALLAISVVGLVLIPVLALGLAGLFLLGFVVVGHWLGKHLHDTTRQGLDAPPHVPLQSPTLIIEVLLGVAIILSSTVVPVIFLPTWVSILMFLLIYAISCVGIGATVLSRFGTLAPPKQRYPHKLIYPTTAHNHYGSSLPHSHVPQMMATASGPAEHTNTRPLGPAPSLPREE